MDFICESDKPNLLSRVLDGYCKLPDPGDNIAATIISMIRRIIEETDWKPGLLSGHDVVSGSCRSKLPKQIYKIYQSICNHDLAEVHDYRDCLISICNLSPGHI